MTNQILVTGGLGYIGSHTVIDLIDKGYCPIIIDNCSNSNLDVLNKLEQISQKKIEFYNAGFSDQKFLNLIFKKYEINSIIHFAAFKSVPESVQNPLKYYTNNIDNLKALLNFVKDKKIKSFVFSSSAAIYSEENQFPVNENGILGYQNPYAFTKLCGEWLIKNFFSYYKDVNVGILRYFNPLGNHGSGLIGDPLLETSTNVMPLILKSILTKSNFRIYGGDYDTFDGTPVRDYIHVEDLADAHSKVYEFLKTNQGIYTFNVGLGLGISVGQLINKFEKINNISLNAKIEDRRVGDLPICFADNRSIISKLAWEPKHNLDQMCRDAFEFFKNNYNYVC
jgi:UDP-glucose 4-epimerase